MPSASQSATERLVAAGITPGPLLLSLVGRPGLLLGLIRGGLATHPGVRVSGSFATSEEYLRVLDTHDHDTVLIDVRGGVTAGIDLGVRVKRSHPDTGVLLLSSYPYPDLFDRLPVTARTGWAYLVESDGLELDDLVVAARAAADGRVYLRPTLDAGETAAPLNPRERDVLALVRRGSSNRAIADALHVSVKTIEATLSSVYLKVGIDASDPACNARVLAALLGDDAIGTRTG